MDKCKECGADNDLHVCLPEVFSMLAHASKDMCDNEVTCTCGYCQNYVLFKATAQYIRSKTKEKNDD